MKARQTIVYVIEILLIVLWVYTASSKIFERNLFEFNLGKSPLIGKELKVFVSYALPLVELAVAVLLITKRTKQLGFISSTALLAIFTVYLIGMVSFSKELPCSCGGVISMMSWTQHIFFNLFFLAISILGMIWNRKQNSNMFGNRVLPA